MRSRSCQQGLLLAVYWLLSRHSAGPDKTPRRQLADRRARHLHRLRLCALWRGDQLSAALAACTSSIRSVSSAHKRCSQQRPRRSHLQCFCPWRWTMPNMPRARVAGTPIGYFGAGPHAAGRFAAEQACGRRLLCRTTRPARHGGLHAQAGLHHAVSPQATQPRPPPRTRWKSGVSAACGSFRLPRHPAVRRRGLGTPGTAGTAGPAFRIQMDLGRRGNCPPGPLPIAPCALRIAASWPHKLMAACAQSARLRTHIDSALHALCYTYARKRLLRFVDGEPRMHLPGIHAKQPDKVAFMQVESIRDTSRCAS